MDPTAALAVKESIKVAGPHHALLAGKADTDHKPTATMASK
jgi:hypothetical protein